MSVTESLSTKPSDSFDPDFGREEMNWLEAHGDELIEKYAGKWVAVQGSELVAVADDVVELLERARAAGHEHPLVTGVPTEPIRVLIARQFDPIRTGG